MSREAPQISVGAVTAWLQRRYRDALLLSVSPVGSEEDASLKDYGYGRPVRVTFETEGQRRDVVLRTMGPDPFGHDRASDRLANLALARDTFGTVPRHVAVVDFGVITAEGALVSVPPGEPFLVTDYAPGRLYAEELREVARLGVAPPDALRRVEILAR